MAFTMSMGLFSCQNENLINPVENQDQVSTNESINPFENMTPVAISINEGVARIGFVESAIFYYLTLSRPGAVEYLRLLEEAEEKNIPVKVGVYDDTDEISCIEPASDEAIEAFRKSQEPLVELRGRIGSGDRTPEDPNALSYTMSYSKMLEIFNRIKFNSNIPFEYIGNGCMARAHEMARIINESGYKCEKLFIFSEVRDGKLQAYNGSGKCCATWRWHVAVIVVYENYRSHVKAIFDPGIFNEPVSIETWKNACTNQQAQGSNCTEIKSQIQVEKYKPSEVYTTSMVGEAPDTYDYDYSETNAMLDRCRKVSGCGYLPR